MTCVLLGIQFGRFVSAARAGELPLPHRPPGVEGFLPISGLMGLVDWIYQGTLNTIHPAATVLFVLFLVMSVLFRKSFCSWVCPVGFLSEALARLGRAIFGRNFRIWRWLDVPLRGLKYLLLAFFLWAILNLGAESLRGFLESPYNRVADVKTGVFFLSLGQVGIDVLIVLALGSILVKGFWCRYLCPYGALLGLVSWMSPAKIRRDPVSCIDCGLCDKVCMARQPVSQKLAIWSPECTSCLDCVAVCPIKDALNVQVAAGAGRPRSMRPRCCSSSWPATRERAPSVSGRTGSATGSTCSRSSRMRRCRSRIRGCDRCYDSSHGGSGRAGDPPGRIPAWDLGADDLRLASFRFPAAGQRSRHRSSAGFERSAGPAGPAISIGRGLGRPGPRRPGRCGADG